MSVWYTSDKLIEAVRRRASLPKADSLYSDEDILAFATDEMYDEVVSIIRNTQEEYLVFTVKIPVIQNQKVYDIPDRSIASELRDIYFEDNAKNMFEMTRILPDDKYNQQYYASTGRPYYFYMENNTVVMTASPQFPGTGNLVMKFMIRPSALVVSSRVAKITNIDRNTGIISVDALPSVFTSSSLFDFTKTRPGHQIQAISLSAALNFASNQMTFSPSDIPEGLAVGDRITLENESDIPQIPTELHRLVIAKTVERVLEGIRDTEGLANAMRKTQKVETAMTDLMDNRVTSAPLKIKNKTSLLKRALVRNRRW